jgi:hypothetical protein
MYVRLGEFCAGNAIDEPMHSDSEGKVNWEPCTLVAFLITTISRGNVMEPSNLIRMRMFSDDHHQIYVAVTPSIGETILRS